MNGAARFRPVPPCDPQKLAEHNANIERDDMGQHSLKNVLTEALKMTKPIYERVAERKDAER